MNRNCPICDSENKEILYTQKFYPSNILLFNEYDVVVCKECGFTFADRIPTQEEFNNYYKNLSKYEFKTSEQHKRYCREMFDFIEPSINSYDDLILDVGCANGDLLNEFKKGAFENVLGLEPSSYSAAYAKNNYDVDVIAKEIFEFETDKKFDFILFSAVFEHIVTLKEVIEKVSNLLKDNGKLFIEVPNNLEFLKYIDAPFQQFSIEHINYFSIRSLCNLLSENFVPIRVESSVHKSNNLVEPSIKIIFQKTNKKREIKKDLTSKYSIKEYINASQLLENILKSEIQEKLKDEKEIIIWGCGTQTLHLLGNGMVFNKVAYFVDSNQRYQGKNIGNKEIKSPSEIKDTLPIFISTFQYKDQIEKQIREDLKLTNKII